MTRTSFPDFHVTSEDIIAEGDKVVSRWTASGTHKGELFGIPPTGKKATWKGISIYRFADGKIVEAWGDADFLGLLQQLGVMPVAGSMPARVQKAFDKAMEVMKDTDQDGIPDIFQGAVQVVDLSEEDLSKERRLRLQEAKDLFDAGLISDQDYQATKKQILSS